MELPVLPSPPFLPRSFTSVFLPRPFLLLRPVRSPTVPGRGRRGGGTRTWVDPGSVRGEGWTEIFLPSEHIQSGDPLGIEVVGECREEDQSLRVGGSGVVLRGREVPRSGWPVSTLPESPPKTRASPWTPSHYSYVDGSLRREVCRVGFRPSTR